MIEFIKDTAGLITAVATIISFVVAAFKLWRKIDKKLSTIEDHTLDNYLDIKRLTFLNKDMPISERLAAGEKYVKAGGNGEIKLQYQVLREKHKNDFK